MRIVKITLSRALLNIVIVGMGLSSIVALADPATHRILSNGLKVIVQEDHRSPVVVSMVWYRAGSIDEFNGTTGVAHVLEHMMFKGTKLVPNGKFSRRIAIAGGRDNAFTSMDCTAYHQQLHRDKLSLAMQLEADRMQNLVFSPTEFAKEMQVVMEERRWRIDDKPHAFMYERFMATAMQTHPYQRPIIGWMDDLINMDIQDAKSWYQTWYAPNNATLVIVGDVKPEEVFALANTYFGNIKAKPLPVRKPQVEPEQVGMKRLNVKAPAKFPYLLMGYKVPVLKDIEKDWEPYALEVLTGLLDGDATTRLNKNLIREQQIAAEVGSSYESTARGPGIFILDGTPSEGKSVAQLEVSIRQELQKIIRDGVTEDELNRVKSKLIASQVFQLDSMVYQAMLIGGLEMAGLSYQALPIILNKLKSVTAQQIQEVTKKYFIDDHLTVAVLDPQPLDSVKPMQPPKGLHHGQ